MKVEIKEACVVEGKKVAKGDVLDVDVRMFQKLISRNLGVDADKKPKAKASECHTFANRFANASRLTSPD